MRVIHKLEDARLARPAVVSIGNFDGVHLGHRRIVAQVLAEAIRRAAASVLVTFAPHPLRILAPARAPCPLTTMPDRLALLERLGLDAVVVLPVHAEFLALSADEFLARFNAAIPACAFVEGVDFNFGRDRGGDVETLRRAGAGGRWDVLIADTVRCDALPGAPAVHSGVIRAALRDGRVADAAAMLGRPHRLTGVVERGDGRGRTIGFPTANIGAIPQCLPAPAVYAAWAQVSDGRVFSSAVNIGPQPTFGQDSSRVEAHLIGFAGNLLGEPIALELVEQLRPQQRFASVGELVAQIRRDVGAAGVACEKMPPAADSGRPLRS